MPRRRAYTNAAADSGARSFVDASSPIDST
jgi:hypothetical protein